MVSEDSDELRSGFSTVHRLDDPDDFQQALTGPMAIAGDELDACCELREA